MGLDFLETNRCVLDLAKGKIVIADKSVALVPNSSSVQNSCSSVTISHLSEMEIIAHIDSKED